LTVTDCCDADVLAFWHRSATRCWRPK